MIQFMTGKQSSYDKLVARSMIDETAMYVIKDSRVLYKGYDRIASDSVAITSSVPEFSKAFTDKLYIVCGTNDSYRLFIKGQSEMEEIAFSTTDIESLDCFKNGTLLKKADGLRDTDEAIATAGCVKDAVDASKTKWNVLETGGI